MADGARKETWDGQSLTEKLLDDSTRIADRIRSVGGEVELEVFEDLIQVFQALAPHVPEGLEAIEKLGSFLKRHL